MTAQQAETTQLADIIDVKKQAEKIATVLRESGYTQNAQGVWGLMYGQEFRAINDYMGVKAWILVIVKEQLDLWLKDFKKNDQQIQRENTQLALDALRAFNSMGYVDRLLGSRILEALNIDLSETQSPFVFRGFCQIPEVEPSAPSP